jgi:hypothetical protein
MTSINLTPHTETSSEKNEGQSFQMSSQPSHDDGALSSRSVNKRVCGDLLSCSSLIISAPGVWIVGSRLLRIKDSLLFVLPVFIIVVSRPC